MEKSLIPIITQVKIIDKDDEDAQFDFDLDRHKSEMSAVFDQWLDNYVQEKQLDKTRIAHINEKVNEEDRMDGNQIEANTHVALDFSSLANFWDHVDRDHKLVPVYTEYIKTKRFLRAFTDKLIAVDPLDRPLWAQSGQMFN